MAKENYQLFKFTKPEPPRMSVDGLFAFIKELHLARLIILDGLDLDVGKRGIRGVDAIGDIMERVDFEPDPSDFALREDLLVASRTNPSYYKTPKAFVWHASPELLKSLREHVYEAEKAFTAPEPAPAAPLPAFTGPEKLAKGRVEILATNIAEVQDFQHLRGQSSTIIIGQAMAKTGYKLNRSILANQHKLPDDSEELGIVPLINDHISEQFARELYESALNFSTTEFATKALKAYTDAIYVLIITQVGRQRFTLIDTVAKGFLLNKEIVVSAETKAAVAKLNETLDSFAGLMSEKEIMFEKLKPGAEPDELSYADARRMLEALSDDFGDKITATDLMSLHAKLLNMIADGRKNTAEETLRKKYEHIPAPAPAPEEHTDPEWATW